jgi:hypothetical protein
MANESIRIRTTPGTNGNIRFKIEQDFDFLEVLSLKISQEDLYQTFCSNYGVVVGRVIANKGFGVPNAKVSVFVPITNEDQKNLLIKDLYPFKTPYQKDSNGIRYNLLLSKSTCILNKPVGTFPTKEEVLDNDLVLEIFDKYYRYTTKTNDAGDFMIFGVPTGQQTVHMDVDLSDAGVVSIRPYDLIDDGYPEKLFQSRVEFKTSTNLDTLPQIKSGNIGVDVIPFWGDPENCEIGISRVDFDTNFEIKTSAIMFGSIFTDSAKMSLNKGCNPRNDMGEQNELRTGVGTIGMIRVKDIDPADWFNNGDITPTSLEEFSIGGGDLINDDGVFAFTVPMNIGHVITDEFGNTVPSADPSIGVATKGMYRFKMKFTEPNENPKFRTATMFFPSLGRDFGGTQGQVDTGVPANANGTQDQRWTKDICQYNLNPAKCGGTVYNNSRILLDFHTFEWKQLYTIAHYIKKYKKGVNRFSFVGIKNTDVSAETNLFPFTNAIWKFSILYYIIAFFIDFFAFILKLLIILVSFCLLICVRLGFSFSILGNDINITIINFCRQICPFSFLGSIIPAFTLPCDGAPNDSYTIPPGGGNLSTCNPNGCNGSFICRCSSNPCTGNADIRFEPSGISTSDNPCLAALEDWKCCVKYNLTEDRNVIRRVFNDAWVFGTAYLFQFKYKRRIDKNGNIKKEKFCGPGSDNLRGDNYKLNQCCLDTAHPNIDCNKCLLRGPSITQTRNQFNNYHDSWHNQSTTGAVDIDDIIYCNALMSTKIISLGRIEMCQETLESIELATLAGQALHKYAQNPNFYTGTFYENGWDIGYWVQYLKETSYEDPRDVFLYLLHKTTPPCSPPDMFHGSGANSGAYCHEFELRNDPYFFIKEVSKIYTDIALSDGTAPSFTDQDEFNPISAANPYADMVGSTSYDHNYGGFLVDVNSGSRFSPCGGNPSNCYGQPASNWTHDVLPINPANVSPDTNEADNNGWDRYISQNNRNNPNVRANIPYYYFGINPGKTAISKLKKDYFVNQG